ncbi:energy transducer TonB [Ravibacter arvi]|uniref:Energy transducer TonB n=1 Tax=Ravibacter arvi TaxID=2051041 RepID=A0ABP8LYD0_9BACT
MKRLSDQGIESLRRLLSDAHTDLSLLPELLDHLACEAEEKMWEGDTVTHALQAVSKEVTPALVHALNQEHQNLLAMNTSLDEIVFEGRNKMYGAYALRVGYARNVQKGLVAGILLFCLLAYLPRFMSRFAQEKKDDIFVAGEFTTINTETRKEPEIVLPPPAEKAPVQKQIRFLPPEVVTNPVEESPPPAIEDLQKAQISSRDVEGENLEDVILPPAEFASKGKGEAIGAETTVDNHTFIAAEQQPEFEGGQAALSKFLSKHIKYPPAAVRAGIQGRVFMQFTVMPDGRIAEVSVVKGIGFGCDEEATRVVKLMPPWRAGKQAGKPVRVRFTLPVNFALEQ